MSISYTAGGDISPARFCKALLNSPFVAVQADDGDEIYVGISQPGTRDAPGTPADDGLAASSGDQVVIYGDADEDEPMLLSGAAVTAGQLLMSDSTGRGIPVTTGKYYGAQALTAATAANILIRVRPRIAGLA
jgi:hypothetical protein